MKFIKEQRIRFEHCDPAGIVFYPRYFEMLNGLMEDFFREVLEYPFEQMHQDSGIPTVDIKTQFKSPARLGDIISKTMFISKLGKTSCTYQYHFSLDNKTILEGEGTVVFVSLKNNGIEPKDWAALRDKMQAYCE
ncbi:acyl-CoA thioesterase [Chryseobacterium sp. POL2]|uniref:acyl-CoA thioesterase n=1 Tax=Chryseobacterium sp. POL2 TaxID=2713414 RepID=UPI0013E1B421|nr:acyl-CoA thioesterase [Chryseobacterium sp. POL2]QIG90236.1 acyl-CoA thioesterase [Chryseobacterium sp. POL2]